MLEIQENHDLTKLNTFGISIYAKYFVILNKIEDLKELFHSEIFKNNKKLFLGGGSNVLFTKDFDGIVILNIIKGIEILKEEEENIWIKACSGEVWHDLVLFCANKNLWGIENLALIPGTVGGAPMQNIGAYGVEIKETLESIDAYDISTGEKRIFVNQECNFGYRDSIFKNAIKDKYFITAIILKLNKKENKNINYKILKDHIEKNNLEINTASD
ncbi:MAG: UDP-N-acetylmuramate dehydrogenase, partial [bacterium]|nr:UDP-N-acetylmuramate dehydrogenase [bacterium]